MALEGLGVAASVTAILQISSEVIKVGIRYTNSVRHANDDRARLLKGVSKLHVILLEAQCLLEGPQKRKLETSTALNHALMDAKTRLQILQVELVAKGALTSAKWPFRSREVQSRIDSINRSKETISLAINIDQARGIFDIDQKAVLRELPVVHEALFDSAEEENNARCLLHTRVELLREVQTWSASVDGPNVFWLQGMAGTGKSTVARSVAQDLVSNGHLGASFFFKRGEGDRANLRKFFTTIAAQLITHMPDMAPYTKDAIERDRTLIGKAASTQFEKLIVEPLAEVESQRVRNDPLLIVIDALDECDAFDAVRHLVWLFADARVRRKVSLKFFLTSRPEYHLRLGFQLIEGNYQNMILHEIKHSIVSQDIRTFIKHQLGVIRTDFNRSFLQGHEKQHLPPDWPGEDRVNALVDMASPLFIFAATVCRFIYDQRSGGNPKKNLLRIFEYKGKASYSQLHAMYLPILDRQLTSPDADIKAVLEEFRTIVGAIVILATPLSIDELSEILSVDLHDIYERLSSLHSVLHIPNSTKVPVRLLHLSFRDFVLEPTNKHRNKFWMDEKQLHLRMAQNCLRLMETSLKEDICSLRWPGTHTSDVDPLVIGESISSALRYSCLYWVFHVYRSEATDLQAVFPFLTTHLLHWIEVLVLLGKVSEILDILESFKSSRMLRSTNIENVLLLDFVEDAERLIRVSQRSFGESPLQIYSSTLMFAPYESIVRATFTTKIPQWLKGIPIVHPQWERRVQALESADSLIHLEFSTDSQLLVVGHTCGSVQVLHVATGDSKLLIKPPESNTFARPIISHDSTVLISGYGANEIQVWDVASGALLHTLHGHIAAVKSVAVSPDSNTMCTGDADGFLRFWHMETGECLKKLCTQRGEVACIAILPTSDRRLILYGTSQLLVSFWDLESGQSVPLYDGQNGLSGNQSVCVSSDASLVAWTSSNRIIRLWDVATGTQTQTMPSDFGNGPMAFSSDSKTLICVGNGLIERWSVPDAKLLSSRPLVPAGPLAISRNANICASGTFMSKKVQVWQIKHGCPPSSDREKDETLGVYMPSDGSYLIMQSRRRAHRGMEIAAWNPSTGVLLWRAIEAEKKIMSISCSGGNTPFLCGTNGPYIRIWNAISGESAVLSSSQCQHNAVALSPDSRHVVFEDQDGDIQMWHIKQDKCVRKLPMPDEAPARAGHLVSVIAFSNDSKYVAAARFSGTISLWDASTGQCILDVEANPSTIVQILSISSNGRLVAGFEATFLIEYTHMQRKVWAYSLEHQAFLFSRIMTERPDLRLSITNNARLTVNDECFDLGFSGNNTDSMTSTHGGYGLDGSWITWEGKKLLWLPPEYCRGHDGRERLFEVAIVDNVVAIGLAQVPAVFSFSTEVLEELRPS